MNTHKLSLVYLRDLLTNLLAKIQVTEANRAHMERIASCEIRLNNRMRTSLGRASASGNWIELNVRLLNDNPDEIERTFAHELAHLIAPALFGAAGSGHGRGWKIAMRMLGYAPERTHSCNTSKYQRRQKPVAVATCSCGVHQIKPRKLRKILNGARYRCTSCRQTLTLNLAKVG